MRTTSLPRLAAGFLILLVALFIGRVAGAATASAFYGPYQVDLYGRPVALNNIYCRYPYPSHGLSVSVHRIALPARHRRYIPRASIGA